MKTGKLAISKISGKGDTFKHILQAMDGRIIALVAHHPGQRPKEEALAQELADAERLVASWNFLLSVEMEAGELMADSAEQAMIQAAANAGYRFQVFPGGKLELRKDDNLFAEQVGREATLGEGKED